MQKNNQPITTLQNLLDYDVRKFASAEEQVEKYLPEWIKTNRVLYN